MCRGSRHTAKTITDVQLVCTVMMTNAPPPPPPPPPPHTYTQHPVLLTEAPLNPRSNRFRAAEVCSLVSVNSNANILVHAEHTPYTGSTLCCKRDRPQHQSVICGYMPSQRGYSVIPRRVHVCSHISYEATWSVWFWVCVEPIKMAGAT